MATTIQFKLELRTNSDTGAHSLCVLGRNDRVVLAKPVNLEDGDSGFLFLARGIAPLLGLRPEDVGDLEVDLKQAIKTFRESQRLAKITSLD